MIVKQEIPCYGCETFGKLKKVMLHRPGPELELIDGSNHHHWLFDRVPEPKRFREEHDRYRRLLVSQEVEVVELSDYLDDDFRELTARMPNLTYMHDIAVVCSKGAFLSNMAMAGRKDEHRVVGRAMEALGIPILTEWSGPREAFEGCLLLSPQSILVAETERHSRPAVEKFIARALEHFNEVIHVDIPKARRYMHPDTIYNRIDIDLALIYPPAFNESWSHTKQGCKKIDFNEHMRQRGIQLIEVSDSEQARLACSFVPLEPRVILHYDTALDKPTLMELHKKGVEVVFFHPDALTAGGGSLRCLTLRLHRCK